MPLKCFFICLSLVQEDEETVGHKTNEQLITGTVLRSGHGMYAYVFLIYGKGMSAYLYFNTPVSHHHILFNSVACS